MSEPFEIWAAHQSIAIADVQDELAKVWDDTLGRWAGPSKFPDWAAARRDSAYRTYKEWPVSLGGIIPDEVYENWMRTWAWRT